MSGTTEIEGFCLGCSSIHTTINVQTQTVQDPLVDNQAVVTWTTAPGIEGVQVSLNDLTSPANDQTYASYAANGSLTFTSLAIGSSYDVMVMPFGSNGAYCAGATSSSFKVAKQCTTLSGQNYPANGQSSISLEFCNDGTWTFSGSVKDTGAWPESYAVALNIAWADSNGNHPLTFLQTGGLAGGTSFSGSETASFSQSGTSELIEEYWLPISSAGGSTKMSVETNVGNAVADITAWAGIIAGTALMGVCCATGTINGPPGNFRCDC